MQVGLTGTAGLNCSNSPPVPQNVKAVGELRVFLPDSFRRLSGFLVNNRAFHVMVTEDRNRSSVDPVDGNGQETPFGSKETDHPVILVLQLGGVLVCGRATGVFAKTVDRMFRYVLPVPISAHNNHVFLGPEKFSQQGPFVAAPGGDKVVRGVLLPQVIGPHHRRGTDQNAERGV